MAVISEPDKWAPRRQRLRRPALGDMRHLIQIQLRALAPVINDDIAAQEVFTTTNTVWAAITTTDGDEMFDGTNIADKIATIFTTRFITGITEERFVDFGGEKYNIVKVENFDERKLFMRLLCVKRGDNTLEVNKA